MVETRTEDGTSGVKMVSSPKTTKLTKLAKVPSWTKDLTLETYSKQLQTWTDILQELVEFLLLNLPLVPQGFLALSG